MFGRPPLNSNLILLIPMDAVRYFVFTILFKFQSDSINTEAPVDAKPLWFLFKFQSDSINTVPETMKKQEENKALNSNLILLILAPVTGVTHTGGFL